MLPLTPQRGPQKRFFFILRIKKLGFSRRKSATKFVWKLSRRVEVEGMTCYSHSLPFPFPLPAIYLHLEYLKTEKCVHSTCHAFKTKITKLAVHQKHYKSSFLITVIYHYLLLVNKLSVYVYVSIYLCSLFICACMLLCKTGLLLHMRHSHYHHVITNLILIPISPKATPIPMGFL